MGDRPRSSWYVARALQPDPARNSPTAVTQTDSEGLREQELSTYDTVFLCNLPRVRHELVSLLWTYLQRDGGVVICLGDQIDPDAYNQLLLGLEGGSRILPARLRGLADRGEYRFEPGNHEHPQLVPFRGHPTAGLATTPIWRYVKLELVAGGEARVALTFVGGDPAIVEERRGRGRSVVVATAVDSRRLDL